MGGEEGNATEQTNSANQPASNGNKKTQNKQPWLSGVPKSPSPAAWPCSPRGALSASLIAAARNERRGGNERNKRWSLKSPGDRALGVEGGALPSSPPLLLPALPRSPAGFILGSPRDRAEARGGEPRAGHDPVGCTSLGNAPGRAMTTRSPGCSRSRSIPAPGPGSLGAGVLGVGGPGVTVPGAGVPGVAPRRAREPLASRFATFGERRAREAKPAAGNKRG